MLHRMLAGWLAIGTQVFHTRLRFHLSECSFFAAAAADVVDTHHFLFRSRQFWIVIFFSFGRLASAASQPWKRYMLLLYPKPDIIMKKMHEHISSYTFFHNQWVHFNFSSLVSLLIFSWFVSHFKTNWMDFRKRGKLVSFHFLMFQVFSFRVMILFFVLKRTT